MSTWFRNAGPCPKEREPPEARLEPVLALALAPGRQVQARQVQARQAQARRVQAQAPGRRVLRGQVQPARERAEQAAARPAQAEGSLLCGEFF